MGEDCKLEVGKSYPAILTDVTSEHDEVRQVYVTKFTYKVYLSATETEKVEDIFYWWDCDRYKRNTLNKVYRVTGAYNLVLMYKDYRNEMAFANAFKWLEGTRVELLPYRYKGIRYKVVTTERKDSYRVSRLWECMLNNNLKDFEKKLKKTEDYFKTITKCYQEFENKTSEEVNEDPFSNIGYISLTDDTSLIEAKREKRRIRKNKKV